MTTRAEDFFNDTQVKTATKTLVESLKNHQKKLTGVRAADETLKLNYEGQIKKFEEARGGKLFFPFLGSGLGNGALVELNDGSVKYDFITGIGVHFFGHSNAGLIEASIQAALSDTVMQGNLQQNPNSHEFSELLLSAATKNDSRLKHCFLTATGVMGGENALKMAFQKRSPASRVLCFQNCFMGRTLLMSNTTDNPAYKQGLPKVIDVDYLPFYDHADPQGSTTRAVAALKNYLEKFPNQHAAMCFELVLGEGGFYPGTHDFFVALMEICRANSIPILVDEVQSFARTTELFAFQYFNLEKYVDAVWIGKASQICATLFTADMKPKPGLLSQTYTGASTAIAAGVYVLKALLSGGFYGSNGRMAKLNAFFAGKLKEIGARHPGLVTGPFGVGAMVAFQPFDGDEAKVKQLVNKLYDNGVMSFYCGHGPTRVRFLMPAGVVTEADITAVCEILERTLGEVG